MKLRAKIRSDYINGLKDEDFFITVVKQFGYECSKVVGYIDIDERWDVLIKKGDKRARVQVKGLKDAHRYGYTWLELIKDDGTFGWLYGKADVLAIRLPEEICFYKMDLLRKVIDDNVDKTKPILKAIPKKQNGENDYEYMRFRQYNGFSRREDITVIVSLDDIENCKIFTMKYELEHDEKVSSI